MSSLHREINTFVQKESKRWIAWRRQLHQYPEAGWMEYVTTWRIWEELKRLGFQVFAGKEAVDSKSRMGVPSFERLKEEEKRAQKAGVPAYFLQQMEAGHTGVVGVWDTGREGPHIALRFDIDALPVTESCVPDHFPARSGFVSKRNGWMHACGHDGHTAIGLGVAAFLSKYGDRMKGKLTLLFQPAEEGSRGAKAMVEKGWMEGVDIFLSGHIGIGSDLQLGDIAATTHGFLATTKCDVTFRGRSAHAGKEPERGKNALLAASSAVLQLHAISRHSGGQTRVNVGTLIAGTGRNIIADRAEMQLETRGETAELNRYMKEEVQRIIQAVAKMYDVKAETEIVGEGINAESDAEFIPVIESVCAQSEQIHRVIPRYDCGASEDAAYMMRRVQEQGGKATYLLFGTPLKSGHHHPAFDYDEQVLSVAVETLVRTVVDLQEKEV